MKQYTDTILMIEPVAFRYNEQTAVNNYYQKVMDELDSDHVQERAVKEFRAMVDKLEKRGIRVISIKDTLDPDTPDSIFPNNWVSFHADKKVGLYPMFAENRRLERRMDILEMLRTEGYGIDFLVDFTENEKEDKYLEGTGSIVLDRVNKIAYAAVSVRTDEGLFKDFCQELDYRPVLFTANQDVGEERMPIYHTNVMMCIADTFAVVCLDSIDDMEERHRVIDAIDQSGKEIIEITEEQKHHFAGNMLQVGTAEKRFLVMSTAAFSCLDEDQIEAIQEHCPIVHSSLDTIEACGGGSARCMMAEVFLPRNNS